MIQKLCNDIDSAFQKRPDTRELDLFRKVRLDLGRGAEYMEYGAKIDILGDPVQNDLFAKTLQMGTSIAKMVHLSNLWEARAAPPIDAKFQLETLLDVMEPLFLRYGLFAEILAETRKAQAHK